MPNFSPLLKVLTIVMAALVLGMAMFFPASKTEGPESLVEGKEAYVAALSFQYIPDLPSTSGPLQKLNLFLFSLASLWSFLLLLRAFEVKENQTVLDRFFVEKINFVFVSTQAP